MLIKKSKFYRKMRNGWDNKCIHEKRPIARKHVENVQSQQQ
jgi:hypothetical protein